ncbi:hypothetical protein GUITHDRAFT_108825 [Guillardia theta CCMP2712]|uniref:Uncharacterized protein n=1 Tax=Guillardia theta (strain CCMP2712) TaxID=905079 RepID=L1J9H6_GUITC|nr:hypothetical protein GUITHDRAFT_108825 [Guillardia theta CCMP2712]EKX45181.1 hypothetical protein GUITHDRAFT_108825 [Guillardia theta CCMP2712]|eukprot:XP_005832161.1 hypothetical protein GUITHDRAFT_108825 [Guillardia theta CCMP2712]
MQAAATDSSDSDEDFDVFQRAPAGYECIPVNDAWPPSARYESPSIAALPPIPCRNSVTVLEDVVPEELADQVYKFAMEEKEGKPWGLYLHTSDILHCQEATQELRLAAACVKHLWCDYHIDFAEFQRYQHNVIFFPMYSATIHLGRADCEGGEFLANRDGLSHYVRTGYKGAHVGGANAVEDEYTEEEEAKNWQRVEYKFNRSIIIDGSLPHCRYNSIDPDPK